MSRVPGATFGLEVHGRQGNGDCPCCKLRKSFITQQRRRARLERRERREARSRVTGIYSARRFAHMLRGSARRMQSENPVIQRFAATVSQTHGKGGRTVIAGRRGGTGCMDRLDVVLAVNGRRLAQIERRTRHRDVDRHLEVSLNGC